MASENKSRDEREENSGQVEIEPSETEKSGETENKSGDPGRTPGKAEGEDDSAIEPNQ
jgi:hypothetical protein